MNIFETVNRDLCIGCGTCVAVCPKNALELIEDQKKGMYIPKISPACIQCGVCLTVCPGIKKNDEETLSGLESNAYAGKYLKCYAGYAIDADLRYAASSGGLVTALANFVLDIGWANGIIATKMDPEHPLRPIPFIARNKSDLRHTLGSKYCPVPVNLSLKEALRSDKNYVIVGLPCHISGVRNIQKATKHTGERFLLFGLSCNHTPTFNATNYLIKKMGIQNEEITSLSYRKKALKKCNKKFTYYFSLKTKRGEKEVKSDDLYYWGFVFRKFFWPKKCILCEDKLCKQSDITFMDAWLPEFSTDTMGTSLIIVRTKKGAALLNSALQRNIIHLTEIPIEKIFNAQSVNELAKNKAAQKIVGNKLFYTHLRYDNFPSKPGMFRLINAFYFILMNKLCNDSSFFTRTIIDYHVALVRIMKSVKRTAAI